MIGTAAFETVSALLAVMSPIALPEPQDCRAITEPSKRLACYDARNTPTEPAVARPPAAAQRRPSSPPVSSYVPPAASIVANRIAIRRPGVFLIIAALSIREPKNERSSGPMQAASPAGPCVDRRKDARSCSA